MYRKLLPTTLVRKHLDWRLFLMVTSAAIAVVLFTQSLSANPAEGMPMYGALRP